MSDDSRVYFYTQSCPHCGGKTVWEKTCWGEIESPDSMGLRSHESIRMHSGTPCHCAEEIKKAQADYWAKEEHEKAEFLARTRPINPEDPRVIPDPWSEDPEDDYTITMPQLCKILAQLGQGEARYAPDDSGVILYPGGPVIPWAS